MAHIATGDARYVKPQELHRRITEVRGWRFVLAVDKDDLVASTHLASGSPGSALDSKDRRQHQSVEQVSWQKPDLDRQPTYSERDSAGRTSSVSPCQ